MHEESTHTTLWSIKRLPHIKKPRHQHQRKYCTILVQTFYLLLKIKYSKCLYIRTQTDKHLS